MKKTKLTTVVYVAWACITVFSIIKGAREDALRRAQKDLDDWLTDTHKHAQNGLDGLSEPSRGIVEDEEQAGDDWSAIEWEDGEVDDENEDDATDESDIHSDTIDSVSSSNGVSRVRVLRNGRLSVGSADTVDNRNNLEQINDDETSFIDDSETDGDNLEEDKELETAKEGVSELRFPPESKEAWTQWKSYVLMSVDKDTDAYKVLWKLFDVPFKPKTDNDETVYNSLVENRMDFFGSKEHISQSTTMAELIIFFAEKLDYNYDGGVNYWAIQIIKHLGLDLQRDGIGTLKTVSDEIMYHRFRSPVDGMPGMFGYGMQMDEQSDSLLQDYEDYSTYLYSQMP